MGFYTTTSVTEKPHPETPSCAQKTASGKFFTYPIKTQYKNRHNSLKTNQEKPLTIHETASGVFYYKFRHYSAELGRWPSRDPIEEDGGVNLYGFVGNDPIGKWDRLGQRTGMGADCYYTGLCGGDDISGNAGPGIHEPPKNPCVFPCCKVDECKACCLALGVNALAYCAKIPHVAGQWACRTAVALMIVGCQSGCVDCPGR